MCRAPPTAKSTQRHKQQDEMSFILNPPPTPPEAFPHLPFKLYTNGIISCLLYLRSAFYLSHRSNLPSVWVTISSIVAESVRFSSGNMRRGGHCWWKGATGHLQFCPLANPWLLMGKSTKTRGEEAAIQRGTEILNAVTLYLMACYYYEE